MTDLRQLVKEVYIDPVRSVLVIDDEFMSLDKLIEVGCNAANSDSGDIGMPKRTLDLKRASDIVKACRADDRKWLCDIHDGQNIAGEQEADIVKHLHQCDLLILDYHLTQSDHSKNRPIVKMRINGQDFLSQPR